MQRGIVRGEVCRCEACPVVDMHMHIHIAHHDAQRTRTTYWSTRGEAQAARLELLAEEAPQPQMQGARQGDGQRSLGQLRLTRRLRGDHTRRLSPPAGVAGPVLAAPRQSSPAELALDGELAGTALGRVGAAEHLDWMLEVLGRDDSDSRSRPIQSDEAPLALVRV